MGGKAVSVRRARRGRRGPLAGFIVTWDVDSRDASLCARLRRFVYGYTLRRGPRIYRYLGFVEREGVQYLGQSVLFVTAPRLGELQAFLRDQGVAHVVTTATLGEILPN